MDVDNNLYRLDHRDLVNLVCGMDPFYAKDYLWKVEMGDLLSYHGGFQDTYEWNRNLVAEMNEMELYSLYLSLKDSVTLS